MTAIKAIKACFPDTPIQELKKFTSEERQKFGKECCEYLGEVFEPADKNKE